VNDLGRGRLQREWRTIEAMIGITCRTLHGGRRRSLCAECAELHDYAELRLRRCPFGAEKPTCNNCRVHCYRPEMRERVRQVMRFAGPRMLARHPYLAVMHLLVDDRRPAPEKPRPRRAQEGDAAEPGRQIPAASATSSARRTTPKANSSAP
jgi:hypothetical protein